MTLSRPSLWPAPHLGRSVGAGDAALLPSPIHAEGRTRTEGHDETSRGESQRGELVLAHLCLADPMSELAVRGIGRRPAPEGLTRRRGFLEGDNEKIGGHDEEEKADDAGELGADG